MMTMMIGVRKRGPLLGKALENLMIETIKKLAGCGFGLADWLAGSLTLMDGYSFLHYLC